MKFTVLLLLVSSQLGDSFPVRIQNIKGNVVAVRPYTAPLLIMKIKSGTLTKDSVVNCKQGVVDKDYADHGDREIEFKCGDAVLELKGVYFGE